MDLHLILRLLRLPSPLAQLLLFADLRPFLRVHFLYAAIESGLLQALTQPASKDELVRKLGVQSPDLLDSLLDLGVALGELSLRDGRYRLRGGRSKALASKRNDPLAAVVQEYTGYHNSVYRHLPERLRGAPLGNYLDTTGDLIARSSRVFEPFMESFLRTVVPRREPLRILEVGCGSGVYLRYAARLNPRATGVGIDVQADVVRHATGNLRRWGMSDRFRVLHADMRNPPGELDGPFDLATLYNNIYYFAPEDRPDLFRALRSRLASGGALALVSAMRGGGSAFTIDLDLVLRSTMGNTALPDLDELTRQLKECGFETVERIRLVPVEPLYGLIAR